MTTIPVKIFLHGLLVLVPTPQTTDHITALLANSEVMAQASPHDPLCGHEAHVAMIKVKTAASDQCDQAGCTASGFQCVCRGDALKGKRVSLGIRQTSALDKAEPLENGTPEELPASAEKAGSFAYVANLVHAPFNLTLNPAFLSVTPPDGLFVRVDVPFTRVTSCSLSKRDDGGSKNIHSMSLRQLNFPSREDDYSQALAQKVVAEVAVAADAVVTLTISNPDGTGGHDIVLEPGSESYTIDVSNHAPALPLDHPCNDGVARHFAMLYQFAANPPAEVLYPHLRPTKSVPEKGMEPAACADPGFGIMDRPICPIAAFNP